MVLRTISTALILAATLVAAHAQPRPEYLDGIYVGGSIGAHKPQNADMTRNGQTMTAKIGTGVAGTAAIGYGFGNGLRGELELAHRAGSVSALDGAAAGAGANGRLDATSVMGNLIYDIANETSFVPYLGAGIGGARVRASDIGPDLGNGIVSGGATVFAYQAIAGLDYRIGNNLAVGASYRYFATSNANIATSAGDSSRVSYRDHAVLFGMRYAFNPTVAAVAPAAAAQPAAAPAPAPAAPPPALAAVPMAGPRSYTVFFDFDKSAISEDANRVLIQAAESAKAGEFTRIQATGHTDTMGTARYNMALSIRRANAVRDVLIREGIPATQIVVVGRGETQLLVPTPDQTKEPRNRRVEIVIE